MAKRKGSKSFKSGSRARRRRFFDNDSKAVYYRQWLDGYKDPHASNNVIAAQQEYAREKSRRFKAKRNITLNKKTGEVKAASEQG